MAQITARAKFERLYGAAIRDGTIDKAEAKALADYHNELQRLSRDELRQRLAAHGHIDYGNTLNRRPVIVDPYGEWTETVTKPTKPVGELFATPLTDLGDLLISWRPGQKTKFFMITGPSIILTVLHLLGAF